MMQLRSLLYYSSKIITFVLGFKSIILFTGLGGVIYLTYHQSKTYIVKKVEHRRRQKVLQGAVDGYDIESQYLQSTSQSALLDKRAEELEKALQKVQN